MVANVQEKSKPKSAFTAALKKKKKNVNLGRLWSAMNSLVLDAVDKEITKRFKTVIDTFEDDITKINLNLIIKEPRNVDLSVFHEGLQPYIKHYLFMSKRKIKQK